MHYTNGTPAKIGDIILSQSTYGTPFVGVVVKTTPDATACQLQVQPITPTSLITCTAGECLRLDEVGAIQAQSTAQVAG